MNLEITWLEPCPSEGVRLRYALTTSLQSALSLRAQLRAEGRAVRVWYGNVLMADAARGGEKQG